MAVPAAKLAIIVNADVDQATRSLSTLDRRLDRSARNASTSVGHIEKQTRRSGSAMRGFGSGLATVAKTGAIASVALGGALYVGVRKTVGAFQEAEKIAAQTNAVLKSTGGAAGVTAKHVENLAGKLSMLSGADDEAIQSGQNLLLTFTKVQNQAGKGNKIFDRATKTMLDMSVALGQDTKSSAIQLGKALNDPIKGVTALQRVGVSFTASQRDQIKTLVAHGKTLEAQKLILKELNTEFGGSAKAAGQTSAGAFAKLQVAVGNLAEAIGGKLAPYLADAANWLTKFVNTLTAGSSVPGQFADKATGALAQVKAAFQGALGFVNAIINENRASINGIGQTIATVAGMVRTAAGQIAATFAATFGSGSGTGRDIRNIISAVVGFADAFGKVALPVVKRALEGITQYIQGFAQVLRGIIRVISGILTLDFDRAWQGVKDIFAGGVKQALGQVKAMTAPMREIAARVGGAALDALKSAWSSIKGVAVGAFNRVVDGIRSRVDAAKKAATAVAQAVTGALKGLAAKFVQIGKDMMQGLINGVASMADAVKNKIVDVATAPVDFVKGKLGIGSPSKVFHQLGVWVGEGFANGIASVAHKVGSAVNQGLLFPLEAKLRELQAKGEKLQEIASSAPSSSGGEPASSSRVRRSSNGRLAVIAGGKYLQGMGAQVAESKYFGGVTTTRHAHYPNDHYSGNSIDINYAGGGTAELSKLQDALTKLRKKFGSIVNAFIEDAGTANQHLHATFQNVKVGAVRARVAASSSRSGGKYNRVYAAHPTGTKGAALSPSEVMALAMQAGFTKNEARQVVRIAKGESSFMPGIYNSADNGMGLLQMTPVAGGWGAAAKNKLASLGGIDAMRNPMKNMQMAKWLHDQSGFQPWNLTRYGNSSLYGNLQPANIGKVMGGDGGSITDSYSKANDGLVKVNAQQQKAIEKAISFRDAIKSVAGQVSDNLAGAVQKFQDKWEKTKGAAFDAATQAMIANSPAAQELAALQAQEDQIQRDREDAANQKALQDAMSSGDQAAIGEAQFQIDETARQRRIAVLQEQAAKEQADIEASRAAERDKAYQADLDKFETNEKSKTGKLISQLAARTISYAQFVKRVNRILKGIGGGEFDASSDEESAVLGGFSAKQLKALGITPAQYQQILKDASTVDLPSYDGGGYVPGRPGQPVPILAHGGEEVLTPAQQRQRAGGTVTINEYGDRHYHYDHDAAADQRKLVFRIENTLRGFGG